ncbi:aminodeoxychorismate synthase component I [Psychromonas algarum]|uniref:aminodeoxychorismate synthase component I n=1 Tax=Psychromonas algarum TaxID=2555643 RepID=UPI001FB9709B|nr:aminodeoxychorismate synthase component I [Psychromonas sp. RZ22]
MLNIKQHLSSLDWTMFLESASLQHVDSNWSIYTAQPIATLTESNGRTLFHDRIRETTTDMGRDPLAAQSRLRQQLFHALDESEYPFTGGVIAAYQYEMGELFESLHKNKVNTGLDLGAFYCGFYDWAILYNLKDNQYYLMQHQTKNQEKSVNELWHDRYSQLENLTSGNAHDFYLTEEWNENYTESEYRQSFEKIQQYILNGDCYQVNLAQRFQAKYAGDEYQAYQALLSENKAPFAAFIRLPEQVIISVSPERFLLLSGNKVQSKPIKGTMPRDTDPKQDLLNKQQLLNSEKDQAENLMIVDLLRNDIGRVCTPGSVAVPYLFTIESFPAVHHLVSTVTGVLDKPYSCEDLLRACFPGGSITGAPKIRSMEIICELEKYKREIYCGSIAYVNGNGDMDSSITIRTLVCHQQHIYCWAGGGIVADSRVESEYKECFDKVSRILPVLSKLNKK